MMRECGVYYHWGGLVAVSSIYLTTEVICGLAFIISEIFNSIYQPSNKT